LVVRDRRDHLGGEPMTPLDGQEREALEAAFAANVHAHERESYRQGWIDSRAALAAREEPQVSEQDVIADSPYKDTAEWANASEQEKAHWRTMAEAAREDTERPDDGDLSYALGELLWAIGECKKGDADTQRIEAATKRAHVLLALRDTEQEPSS
jgi:hypothetical protein